MPPIKSLPTHGKCHSKSTVRAIGQYKLVIVSEATQLQRVTLRFASLRSQTKGITP